MSSQFPAPKLYGDPKQGYFLSQEQHNQLEKDLEAKHGQQRTSLLALTKGHSELCSIAITNGACCVMVAFAMHDCYKKSDLYQLKRAKLIRSLDTSWSPTQCLEKYKTEVMDARFNGLYDANNPPKCGQMPLLKYPTGGSQAPLLEKPAARDAGDMTRILLESMKLYSLKSATYTKARLEYLKEEYPAKDRTQFAKICQQMNSAIQSELANSRGQCNVKAAYANNKSINIDLFFLTAYRTRVCKMEDLFTTHKDQVDATNAALLFA